MEEPGQLKRAAIDATAGAIAGGISRTVTSPLDVIKIRFQVIFLFFSFISLIKKIRIISLLFYAVNALLNKMLEIEPCILLHFEFLFHIVLISTEFAGLLGI